MSKRENRDTYLSECQIITRIVDTSDKIAQFLEKLGEQSRDERINLHVDNLVDMQNEQTGKIAEYRSRAPSEVTDTYVQYVDVVSGKVDKMIEQHDSVSSINNVTSVALALNEEMVSELENLSINEGAEESREAFSNLQLLIEETCRNISISESMAGDI